MTDLDQFSALTDYHCGACNHISCGWLEPRIWDMSEGGLGRYIQATCPNCHSSRMVVDLDGGRMPARSMAELYG